MAVSVANATLWARFSRFLVVALALAATGCTTLLRNQLNKHYPPVSTDEQRLKSINSNMAMLTAMPPPPVVGRISSAFTLGVVKNYLAQPIPDSTEVGEIRIGGVDIRLGIQEVVAQSDFSLLYKPKHIRVTGRTTIHLAPSVAPKTAGSPARLLLQPSASRLEVCDLDFAGSPYTGSSAFAARHVLVPALTAAFQLFLDNLNGQLDPIEVPLVFPVEPVEPDLSDLPPGVTVTFPSGLLVQPELDTGVVEITPTEINLLATAGLAASPVSAGAAPSRAVVGLDDAFRKFNDAVITAQAPLGPMDTQTALVAIRKDTLAEAMNDFFRQVVVRVAVAPVNIDWSQNPAMKVQTKFVNDLPNRCDQNWSCSCWPIIGWACKAISTVVEASCMAVAAIAQGLYDLLIAGLAWELETRVTGTASANATFDKVSVAPDLSGLSAHAEVLATGSARAHLRLNPISGSAYLACLYAEGNMDTPLVGTVDETVYGAFSLNGNVGNLAFNPVPYHVTTNRPIDTFLKQNPWLFATCFAAALLELVEITCQSGVVKCDDPAFTGKIKETYTPPALPVPFDVTVPTGPQETVPADITLAANRLALQAARLPSNAELPASFTAPDHLSVAWGVFTGGSLSERSKALWLNPYGAIYWKTPRVGLYGGLGLAPGLQGTGITIGGIGRPFESHPRLQVVAGVRLPTGASHAQQGTHFVLGVAMEGGNLTLRTCKKR